MVHSVKYGQGAQTLYHVPRDHLGFPTRVSSATLVIEDFTEGATSSGRTVLASGAATVDAASEQLTAAAGRSQADSRLFTVASTTGFDEGRVYLVAPTSTGDAGEREEWTCARVESTTIRPSQVITGAYPIGAYLLGVEISGEFPAAVANDEDLAIRDGRDYQAIWTYTIDGIVHVDRVPIRVERYSDRPWITMEYAFLGEPRLRGRFSPQEEHEALVAATQEVSGELQAAGVAGEYYSPTPADMLAVRYAFRHNLYANAGGDEDADRAATYRERYKVQILQLTQGRTQGARVVSRHDATSRPKTDELDYFEET